MPYNRPIPDSSPEPSREPGPDSKSGSKSGLKLSSKQGGKEPGLFSAWIQAEKLMQIALVLPCAAFIGWLIGAWLDHRLHQNWIAIAGILFGAVSGLVYSIRVALDANKDPRMQDDDTSDPGKGSGGAGA